MAKKPSRTRSNSIQMQAEALMQRAFEAEEGYGQWALARQATELDPNCAQAYLLLSQYEEDPQQRLVLLEQALAAAEKTIGKKQFESMRGHFWGFHETRPYMQAKIVLAGVLWELRRFDDAIAHYTEMLDLNPNDNQGVRHVLITCLLERDQDAKAAKLLEQYIDDSTAAWLFSAALLAFRRNGDQPESRRLLQQAADGNPYVRDLLVGQRQIAKEQPHTYCIGQEDEAQLYALTNLRCWRGTSGAIPWLRQALGATSPSTAEEETTAGLRRSTARFDWKSAAQQLLQVPQVPDAVWLVDCRQAANSSMWCFMALLPEQGEALSFDIMLTKPEGTKPSNTEILEKLVKLMLGAEEGRAHRPAVVEVRLKSHVTAWQKRLSQVGIECRQAADVHYLNEIMDAFEASAANYNQPAENADLPDDQQLRHLPQAAQERWQVDVRQLPIWTADEGEPSRPWVTLVLDAELELIVFQALRLDPPDKAWLCDALRRALSIPLIGSPRRPTSLAACDQVVYRTLQPLLEPLGIACELEPELKLIDTLMQSMVRSMTSDSELPALVDSTCGALPAMAEFYSAASQFYKAAPWKNTAADSVIQIQSSSHDQPDYAVVMGQMGMTLGLAMYDDWQALQRALRGDVATSRADPKMTTTAVDYNEAFDINSIDLFHIEQYQWEIASPEAYPKVIHVEGRHIDNPSPDALRRVVDAMWAIPAFLQLHSDPQVAEQAAFDFDIDGRKLRLNWVT